MCVLLDEVESLTRARSASVSGSEPADAIRAVNALLTQVRPSCQAEQYLHCHNLCKTPCTRFQNKKELLAAVGEHLLDLQQCIDSCVQLDALKAYPNVLVLTTSNITEAIDLAFVDRADIKAYVGPPGNQVSINMKVTTLKRRCRNLKYNGASLCACAAYKVEDLHADC